MKFKCFCFLVLIFLNFGCFSKNKNKWIYVFPEEVSRGVLFTCSGFLKLKNVQPLYSSISGQITEILVKVGSHVNKGTVIMKIFQPQIERNILEVNSEIEKISKEIEIEKKLVERGILQESQISANFNKLKKLNNEKNNFLHQKEIRSFEKGVLQWLNVSLFDWVNQGEILGYVFPENDISESDFEVEVNVLESQIQNVWKGQEILVKSEIYGNLEGEVVKISPFLAGSENSEFFKVFCKLKKKPKNIFFKLPVEVVFFTKRQKMLAIPRIAFFKSKGKNYLYVLRKKPEVIEVNSFFEGEEFFFIPYDPKFLKEKIIINFEEKLNVT